MTAMALVIAAAPANAAEPGITLRAEISGTVTAQTLRLEKATIVITGDTTIVAETLEFASANPRIVTHGHSLKLQVSKAVSPGIHSEITIVTNGDNGANGTKGNNGQNGFAGRPGWSGRFGCPGEPGGYGEDGTSGNDGQPGDRGADGSNGGDIWLEIPPGSEDSYYLFAHGGKGGSGGGGGNGGSGGAGGRGGTAGAAGAAGSGGSGGVNYEFWGCWTCYGQTGPEGFAGVPGSSSWDGSNGNSGGPGFISIVRASDASGRPRGRPDRPRGVNFC